MVGSCVEGFQVFHGEPPLKLRVSQNCCGDLGLSSGKQSSDTTGGGDPPRHPHLSPPHLRPPHRADHVMEGASLGYWSIHWWRRRIHNNEGWRYPDIRLVVCRTRRRVRDCESAVAWGIEADGLGESVGYVGTVGGS